MQNSLEQIHYLNSLRTHNQSAVFGPTQYSDLSTEEFLQLGANLGAFSTVK